MTETTKLDLYLIFHSIHNVMLAEELLNNAGITNDMIPVPRKLSSDCGMSLKADRRDLNLIKTTLAEAAFTSPVMIYELKPAKVQNERSFQLLLTL